MTTIAYKNGILAADQLIEQNGMVCAFTTKIGNSKSHNIMGGIAGSLHHSTSFLNWLMGYALPGDIEDNSPTNPILEKTDGLIVVDDDVYFFTDGIFTKVSVEFTAIGTGQNFAMAAMVNGATAEEAVQIATVLDVYSGGNVETLAMVGDFSPELEFDDSTTLKWRK